MRIILMGIKEELIGATLIIQRELLPNVSPDWPCAYRGVVTGIHLLPGASELGRHFPFRVEYTDVYFTCQFPNVDFPVTNQPGGVWTPLLGGKGPRLVIDVLKDPLFLEAPSGLSEGGFLWGACDIDTYFNRPSGPHLGKGYFKIVPGEKKMGRIMAIHNLAML